MPTASTARRIIPNPDRALGLSLLLGADYERKKQKLNQELRLDYKQYVAKKEQQKTTEPRPQPQGLSLQIDDKLSVKERLREERNKEYNLFLQNKVKNRRFKKQTPPVTFKPVQASDACPASPLTIRNTHTPSPPPHRGHPHRRNVATLTEAVDNGTSKRRWDPGHQGRTQWQLYRAKEPHSSEEEQIADKDEELAFRQRRQKERHTPEPEHKEEWRNRKHSAKSLKMPDNMMGTTRSRSTTSIKKAEIATALMIGTIEDPTASQMRKEQYRQELLKQIAEQQRNKLREKNLELSVAATGATKPEKEPDISYKPGIDQKARGRDPDPRPKEKPIEKTENGGPHGKSQMDYSTGLTERTVPGSEIGAPRGVLSSDYFNQDYHRDFSNMLDVGIPRVAIFPPPIPPAISNIYQTPYDAAYYYYGTRNPLDPHLPYHQNGLPRVAEQSWNFHSPPQRPPPLRPSDLNEASDQLRASFLNVEETPADKTKRRSESYQEAIRQQIKEREEHKRREVEEKEQYNAKMEAEMMAYNPWGKSGGGAPIKDEQGNLLSDLNQMHRKNKFYRKDQPTSMKLHMQEKYTEDLKQQIEDNKKRKAKEREKMRAEDEKEEKRLAEQSACMPWKYEEEQMKQKKTQEHSVSAAHYKTSQQVPASFDDQPIPLHLHMQERNKEDLKEQHRVDKQSWINEPKTHPQKEEKRARQEQETEIKIPESTKDREEKKRQQSPPIPTLQKKQTNMLVSSSPSVASQVSPRTERSLSAPHYKTSLQGDQQEVLRQLSSLRRHLQKEKEESQMKIQRSPTDWGENDHTPNRRRERPSGKTFEMGQKQSDYPPADRHYSGAARVNIQNIREFNQLKYRDTASREEVLYTYPNPPTDAESLDIQQQALLREQQRKLRLMKREEHNFLEQQPNHYPRNKPGRFIHRDAMLPSETVFIDFYSGDACEERVHQQSTCGLSVEDQEGTASGRKHDSDQVNQGERDIQPDTQEDRVHNRYRVTRQDSDTGEHKDRSEKLSGDEVDALVQHSALERNVSIETVATEPWLRPSTSHSVQGLSSRQRPRVRTGNLPFL